MANNRFPQLLHNISVDITTFKLNEYKNGFFCLIYLIFVNKSVLRLPVNKLENVPGIFHINWCSLKSLTVDDRFKSFITRKCFKGGYFNFQRLSKRCYLNFQAIFISSASNL